MAEQFSKDSTKPNSQRRDILENQVKLRSILKNASRGNKLKSDLQSCSKPSARPSSHETTSETYYRKCYEDHQVRLKLLELTPRNPAKQTSEGVQEFIKQVSHFIEKKNPFKDNVLPSFDRFKRHGKSAPFDSVEFNSNKERKYNIQTNNSEDPNIEIPDDDDNSSRLETKNLERQERQNTKKNSGKTSLGKKNRMNGSPKKKDQSDKKRQNEEESSKKKCAELRRVITLNENPVFYYENERRSFSINRSEKKSNEGSNKQNQGKKRKPSEIPLRKNRKDGTKNPKPVSLLMQKSLKDVDSAVSIDLYSKKKPFSPIEELSLCSEIQITINAIGSSEKINERGKTSDSELIKRKSSEDSLKNTKLNRCCKSPYIPVETNFSYILMPDEQNSISKKPKVLDLEKLKTSSFTVLRSNTTAFNRLESLHKRNVSSKEKITTSSSKSKLLTLKSSYTTAKEKNSKKSLSCRVCNKGNKTNLKAKEKKNKKETDESFPLPKRCPHANSKTSHLELCKEIIATGKVECLVSGVCKIENCEDSNIQKESKESRSTEAAKKEKRSNLPVKFGKRKGKSILRKIKSSKEKELKMSFSTTPVVSRMRSEDFSKWETPGSTRSSFSNRKSEKSSQKNVNVGEGSEFKVGFKSENSILKTPPSNLPLNFDILETSDSESRPEEDESSSKTVILDDAFNQDEALCSISEADTRKKSALTRSILEKAEGKLKIAEEALKIRQLDLVIRGTPLNLGRDEPPEKPESADSTRVKMQLKIDLTSQTKTKTPEKAARNVESFDWLFANDTQCDGKLADQKPDSNVLKNEEVKEKKSNGSHNISLNSVGSEIAGGSQVFRKPRKCCSSLKRRMQYKTSSVNMKGVRKKMRSNAGDRRLGSSGSFFISDLSLQNKSKSSPKNLKSGSNEEHQRDLFEDATAVKLRRRNSEPHSFKEFVWKRTDFTVPKGLKPSVSSLASSLRHLNTDDIDDFIFWEPVPQNLTSCWESSLYHFKKPWTVLSCSVFKDNRQSNKPGLILENLRNGGSLNKRPSPVVSRNERVNCHKDNPFDVEPSIAQKNIDIRNWLAALNFPTSSTTSNEQPMSEGNFSTQSTLESQKLKNIEVSPKRRKVLPNIKFSDETPGEKEESNEKYKASAKWNASEAGGLMELIRRKSGGFVTKEQFLNSERSVHSPKVTVSFCVYSKSPDENDEETKLFKSLEVPSLPGVSVSATIVDKNSFNADHSVDADVLKEKSLDAPREKGKLCWRSLSRREMNLFQSNVNVWKYLFLLTILIVTVHYCF